MRKCCQLKQQFCIAKNKNLRSFETSTLDIRHFNIRSLTRNCDNLQNYLAIYNFCTSANVLSETRHSNSTEICKLTGYKGFLSSNGENRSSGIPIFVCNSLNVIDEQCTQNSVSTTYLFSYKSTYKNYQQMPFATPHQLH